jgi:hypothetical protein
MEFVQLYAWASGVISAIDKSSKEYKVAVFQVSCTWFKDMSFMHINRNIGL